MVRNTHVYIHLYIEQCVRGHSKWLCRILSSMSMMQNEATQKKKSFIFLCTMVYVLHAFSTWQMVNVRQMFANVENFHFIHCTLLEYMVYWMGFSISMENYMRMLKFNTYLWSIMREWAAYLLSAWIHVVEERFCMVVARNVHVFYNDIYTLKWKCLDDQFMEM